MYNVGGCDMGCSILMFRFGLLFGANCLVGDADWPVYIIETQSLPLIYGFLALSFHYIMLPILYLAPPWRLPLEA